MVTEETLRAMLREFGGVEPTEEEMERVLASVRNYQQRAEPLGDLDLSTVLSGRLLHAQEGGPQP